MSAKKLWAPTPERAQHSNLHHFMQRAAAHDAAIVDYASLHAWSINRPHEFWQLVWEFCGVQASATATQVLQNPDAMPGAVWFDGARLNFAENLLRYRDSQTAIEFYGEDAREQRLTYAELFSEVARCARLLKQLGVGEGDRVAACMANIPQAIIAMLACASLGAIWSSCSPDFGVNGILERFSQITPKVLFAVDGYRYAGKRCETLDKIAQVVAQIDSIEKVVVVAFLDARPDVSRVRDAMLFDEFQDAEARDEMDFAQLPFNHPLFILYSSGTTGAPKCIVHGAGGTLLQHLKEHQLHADVKRDDALFFFTTCGWMMWNWLATGLASGCTLVLYDGSPLHPRASTLWEMAASARVTVFGASARFFAAAAKHEVKPSDCDLSALRAVLSTGSPLAPETFDYLYAQVKSDLMLSSITGGTDIVSCFALGNPLLPVYRGEIQCIGLGMAVDVYDDDGQALRGARGELVCTKPFPSMPLGFWNETDGARYHRAYFAKFPNVWAHGDYAEITSRGGLVIHGRSDAVLNPGGVRIGTAEIYRQVEMLDEVMEALCIGQQWDGDTRIVLFVLLRERVALDDALRERIRQTIKQNASPRHAPAKIIQAPDIPRTLNGKIVELAVRNAVHGEPVKNADALANPESLEFFRDLDALKS